MKSYTIKLDKERPLLFTLQSLDEINKKYGSIHEMEKVFSKASDNLAVLSDFVWILALLVNQAALSHNMDIDMGIKAGEKDKLVTEEYIKLKLRPVDLMLYKNQIFGAIAQGCSFETDEDEEEVDVDLQEIQASKKD